jgi:hypothetical protein
MEASVDTALDTFVAPFGDDCVVVDDFQADSSLLKKKKWVFEDLGGQVHVLHGGATFGFVDLGERSFGFELGVDYMGDDQVLPSDEAKEWMENEMWPAWEARGYRIDESCSPDNGWDDKEQYWRLNIVRSFETIDALAEEVKLVADQETFQHIG